MEVTKWLKPSDSVSRIGDSASVQAVTRVNAEQTSKRTMRRPTVKSHPSPTPFRVQGRPPAGCQCFCSDEAETGVAEPHIAEQSRSWRARVASGRLCAVLEAPAVVAGLDDVAVVGEPIEHGGCHFGVAEHLRPIGEGQIGGDQQ